MDQGMRTGDAISELRAEMREDAYEERETWLESLGCSGADVLVDEEGDEFVMTESESGNPGDDYQFSSRKVVLPTALQSYNINKF